MSGSGIGQFIPLILIFIIFYFFLIRPQQKKVKEHKLMVENLKRGDKVVTSGGIIGTIERVIDNEKVEVSLIYDNHLGSYFSALQIIDEIYAEITLRKRRMDKDDIFILSNGHAVVALYAVLEKYYGLDAGELHDKYGDHPKRNELDKLHCSTGSLGMGVTVAVGRALANPDRNVYCLLSDGECAEGSVWEALRFAYDNKITNLKIYVNANGWSAYDPVDLVSSLEPNEMTRSEF